MKIAVFIKYMLVYKCTFWLKNTPLCRCLCPWSFNYTDLVTRSHTHGHCTEKRSLKCKNSKTFLASFFSSPSASHCILYLEQNQKKHLQHCIPRKQRIFIFHFKISSRYLCTVYYCHLVHLNSSFNLTLKF